MRNINRITHKVVLYKKIKNKVPFFDTAVYPVYIRMTQGQRTLYQRSNLFTHIHKNQEYYQVMYDQKRITIEDIMKQEAAIFDYIIQNKKNNCTLETLRWEYIFFSHDLLYEIDEFFKSFLCDFFTRLNLPFYSVLIAKNLKQHTSESILNTLKHSLKDELWQLLNKTIVDKNVPYLPFLDFYAKVMDRSLPVFPFYLWSQHTIIDSFNENATTNFADYSQPKIKENIDKIIKKTASFA